MKCKVWRIDVGIGTNAIGSIILTKKMAVSAEVNIYDGPAYTLSPFNDPVYLYFKNVREAIEAIISEYKKYKEYTECHKI